MDMALGTEVSFGPCCQECEFFIDCRRQDGRVAGDEGQVRPAGTAQN